MNATPLLSDASGAGRVWGAGKVETSRNHGNPISPLVFSRTRSTQLPRKAGNRSYYSTTDLSALRIPEPVLPSAAEALRTGDARRSSLRTGDFGSEQHLDLEFESPRYNEAFSAVLLALIVAGLLVFALS